MIRLFVSNNCKGCHEIEKFFEKNKVAYDKRNIDEDFIAKEYLQLKGIRSVPALEIDYKEWIIGYSRRKLEELLKRREKR